jgi:hypothetical protein
MILRALSQPVLNQDFLLFERKIFPSDSPALIVRTHVTTPKQLNFISRM